jgi:2'-5' RNA ligase
MYHANIKKVVEEIKAQGANVKFVEPENSHITLRFFGEIDEELTEKISKSMEKACEGLSAMKAKLEGVGVFPSLKYMRVIWIDVDCPSLIRLKSELDSELIQLGFKVEKSFKPHLTIGRIKSSKNKEKLSETIEKLKGTVIGDVKIDEIKLKMSRLTPKGPIYTDLKVIKL